MQATPTIVLGITSTPRAKSTTSSRSLRHQTLRRIADPYDSCGHHDTPDADSHSRTGNDHGSLHQFRPYANRDQFFARLDTDHHIDDYPHRNGLGKDQPVDHNFDYVGLMPLPYKCVNAQDLFIYF